MTTNISKYTNLSSDLVMLGIAGLRASLLIMFLHVALGFVLSNAGDAVIPGRTLFVTAHPDDEVMFFGPSILRSQNSAVLCLSHGVGNGTARSQELTASCACLGVDLCSVADEALPDGFEFTWRRNDIRRIVHKYADVINPDRIVTFDGRGVSGHPNHIAISHALSRAPDSPELDNSHAMRRLADIPVYALQSGSFFTKYLSVYSAALYAIVHKVRGGSGYFAFTPGVAMTSAVLQRAFLQHKTQQTWYRILWLVFSRFLFFNNLAPLDLS